MVASEEERRRLEIAHEAFDSLFNRGDRPAIDRSVHERFVGTGMFGGLAADCEGLTAFAETVAQAFPDAEFSVDDADVAGEVVVHDFTARGTHLGEFLGVSPTGESFIVSGTVTTRFVGDRIRSMAPEWDALDMMRQLGVLPPRR